MVLSRARWKPEATQKALLAKAPERLRWTFFALGYYAMAALVSLSLQKFFDQSSKRARRTLDSERLRCGLLFRLCDDAHVIRAE